MDETRQRIEAEYESIDNALAALPKVEMSELSELELAGVAAILHNFYNGIENIIKQVFLHQGIELPAGSSWHRDLLQTASERKLLPPSLVEQLKRFLAFRHFFIHAYALELDTEKLAPLVREIDQTFKVFRESIDHKLRNFS